MEIKKSQYLKKQKNGFYFAGNDRFLPCFLHIKNKKCQIVSCKMSKIESITLDESGVWVYNKYTHMGYISVR